MYSDWMSALVGGLMIGAAASILLLANGRIAGISGIMGRLTKQMKPSSESLLFLAGLIIASVVYRTAFGLPDIEVTSSVPVLILSGLAVGVGTQMGNGCTSGHGICGTARLSKRSIAATLTFIVSGIVTVAVMG